MPSFKGQYEHSVDNKGRVAFPAKLRKLVSPAAQDQFTILRGQEPCLYLYPQDHWEEVEQKLSRVNSFSKNGRTVIRNFLRFAEDVSLDKQNRISLPAHLMDYSGIDSTALFIGTVDRIEIWSPARLNDFDADLSDEYFHELFEKVMGDESENRE
ncbi:MAG: division/cell wall cluster transcriptional repressor MraZ [Balneolaceae bacterium]|nr:MAG: division/cell wall cluster transcriptional repressor MraZ [Balneolaceae bacterium]